ncbi:MAG: hypothetical protein IKV82_02790 [Akkermansia sp.]|nr:hypothetical protein [Akkermansia sp.]
MSIRIREWGMLRNGAEQPHVSVHGLTDWEIGARQAGQGLSAMVLGGVQVVQEREKVAAAGELAAFSEKLQAMEQEISSELEETEPAQWSRDWESAFAARVSDALEDVSPALRETAQKMAAEYTREAGIRAVRDRELAGIDRARRRWQHRVDAAVQSGDAQAARQWLEQGRGVFVPEGRMEAEEKSLESKVLLQQWRRNLQQNPVRTLGDYLHRPAGLMLPQYEEGEQLKHEVEQTQRQAREIFVREQMERAMRGEPADAQTLKQADRAGIITRAQRKSALAAPQEPAHRDLNCWLRRVHECDTAPDEVLALQVDICTAALPAARRVELVQRLEQAASVRREDRLTMSRRLWNLYHDGAFGCPGDALAEQRLHRLQMCGLPLLAESGNDAVAEWLSGLDRRDEQWVCFSPQYA